MFDTKILIDKSIQKIKCDIIDIPIINDSNAILANLQERRTIDLFNLNNIKEGLIEYNNNYYFFEDNIPLRSRFKYYKCGENYSYTIYRVTNELGKQMISEEKYSKWLIFFQALYNYGEIYFKTIKGDFKIKSIYDKSINELTIPYEISPGSWSYKKVNTIGEFLDKHNTEYKKSDILINPEGYRRMIINEIYK